jgi:hypothetical protein
MKHLFIALLFFTSMGIAQNIDDNFITFPYVQLPFIPIEKAQRFVHFEVATDVASANQDSLSMQKVKQANAAAIYKQNLSAWYTQMSLLQQQENSSGLSQAANYPAKPSLELIPEPILNTVDVGALLSTAEGLNISGFEKGNNGLLVSFKIMPPRDVKVYFKRSGSAAATRYSYSCSYYLPAMVTVSKTDGSVVLEKMIGNSKRTKSLGKYKSTYAFLNWFMKNRTTVYKEIENEGRSASIQSAKGLLENQFGFVNKTRRAEIYSVKKYKDYDYTDVALAYNKTTEGLLKLDNNADRANAYETLREARKMWVSILEESNLQNKKERINPKISAIIWCNIAEISVWMGDFNQVDVQVQNIKNSGVFKAKNHIAGETVFYNDQKTRWKANFE